MTEPAENLPISRGPADDNVLAGLRSYALLGSGILIVGQILDFGTTGYAFMRYGNLIQEQNDLIRYFMYSLGLGLYGVSAGICYIAAFECMLMSATIYWTRPKTVAGPIIAPIAIFTVGVLGVLHILGGLSNLTLLGKING